MEPVEYQVILTSEAQRLFNEIKDRREQQLLLGRLEKLKHEPDRQGKALSKELIHRILGNYHWELKLCLTYYQLMVIDRCLI